MAILRALQGDDVERIQRETGIRREEIEAALRTTTPPPDLRAEFYVPVFPVAEQIAYAQRLLTEKFIETYDAGSQPSANSETHLVEVYYSDIATGFEAIVVESLRFLSTYPGVQRVERADREVIHVTGSLDEHVLEQALYGWWRTRLRQLIVALDS